MILINLNDEDILKQVGFLHKSYIKMGLLSQLGISFLTYFYKIISKNEESILIVYLNNNREVIGFITGTLSPKKLKKSFRKNKGIFFLKPYILFRILETRNYSNNFDSSEFISIVVKNDYQGKGYLRCYFKNC